MRNSFEVQVRDPLRCIVHPDGQTEELPLSSLRTPHDHIHGELVIAVDGQMLPHLGYFGPRDVCIGTWVEELAQARRTLSAAADARHLFDEGEQGQPAFLFQRRGATIDVAVVDSQISEGRGDTEWGTRSCSYASFDAEVSRFLEEFESTLETAAPGVGRAWMLRHVGAIR